MFVMMMRMDTLGDREEGMREECVQDWKLHERDEKLSEGKMLLVEVWKEVEEEKVSGWESDWLVCV